jgi:hypothetical protein
MDCCPSLLAALVDTVHSIPQVYTIAPTNITDTDMSEPLIKKLLEYYDNSFTPKYYIMDAGYDKPI